MATTVDTAKKHLADQREYVKKRHLEHQKAAAAASGTTGLVDEKMLAESMRSVRYVNEGHAAGDIIDNAIEAGASQVHIIFRTEGTAIKEIAFVDDASGIDEAFLPHATKWGGSSNEGRRNVFGRFGFGLPSASVNRGRRFQVFSRIAPEQDFPNVAIDLDNLDIKGQVVQLPTVSRGDLPSWVDDYVRAVDAAGSPKYFPGGPDAVRTVVIWSNLDRLTWPNRQQSSARFREHLGITYAIWLGVCKIFVDGIPVEPVDVLFTTPGYRYYEIEGAPNAEPHDPIRFQVADANGTEHLVTVRFSYLSVPAYQAKAHTGGKGQPAKVRFRIRKEYNGVFVTRHGRFIEVAKPRSMTWNNYAQQVGVALDFPPELDELFGVTPDKQTIVFTERVESLLKSHGVVRAFNALVKDVADERHNAKVKREEEREHGDGSRASEETIAKVVEMDYRRTRKTDDETRQEAEKNFQAKVKELAASTGMPDEQVAKAQEELHVAKPYRVEFMHQTEDDPFYTPLMEGTQLILRINTGHPWYRELYSRLAPDAELRSALELMLWIPATCEIDATGPTRIFYRAERLEWSRRMANAFEIHPLVFHGVSSREEFAEDDPAPWAEDDDDRMESEAQ